MEVGRIVWGAGVGFPKLSNVQCGEDKTEDIEFIRLFIKDLHHKKKHSFRQFFFEKKVLPAFKVSSLLFEVRLIPSPMSK